MTKEEYTAMKQAGQLTLPCFYQYYADHIGEARNKTLLSFEEFGTAFPQFLDKMHPVAKEGKVRGVMNYFDTKFGLTTLDHPAGSAGEAVRAAYQQQFNRQAPPDPFGFYNKQNRGL